MTDTDRHPDHGIPESLRPLGARERTRRRLVEVAATYPPANRESLVLAWVHGWVSTATAPDATRHDLSETLLGLCDALDELYGPVGDVGDAPTT